MNIIHIPSTPRLNYFLVGLKQQLAKIHNSSPNCSHSARNHGFIFNEYLTFCDQIAALSKSRYSHTRELPCIHPCRDSKTASVIATSTVHTKRTTVILCITTFQSPKYIDSNRFRTLLPVLSRAQVNSLSFHGRTRTAYLYRYVWSGITGR